MFYRLREGTSSSPRSKFIDSVRSDLEVRIMSNLDYEIDSIGLSGRRSFSAWKHFWFMKYDNGVFNLDICVTKPF